MCVLMCNFVSYFVCVILCIFVFLCDILLPSGVINDDDDDCCNRTYQLPICCCASFVDKLTIALSRHPFQGECCLLLAGMHSSAVTVRPKVYPCLTLV